MYLYDIVQLYTEDKAEEYLRSKGVLRNFSNCIHCNSETLGRIRRGKYKCYSCKREWASRKGSILERIRVSMRQFLLVVKCYELNMSMKKCKRECKVDYSTAERIYTLLNEQIQSHLKKYFMKSTGLTFKLITEIFIHQFNNGMPAQSDNVASSYPTVEIRLKRIRRTQNKFGYRITSTSLPSSLSKHEMGVISTYFRDLDNHLESFTHRNPDLLEAYLHKTVFLFNTSEKGRYDKLLDLFRKH